MSFIPYFIVSHSEYNSSLFLSKSASSLAHEAEMSSKRELSTKKETQI